jgi:phosphatidylinositol glycan class M
VGGPAAVHGMSPAPWLHACCRPPACLAPDPRHPRPRRRPQLLFSGGDILAGWQLWRLASRQRAPPAAAAAAAALWLCNPFTFTISTRGSCDALVANLLLGVLLLLLDGRALPAALLYGLAVHVRIYPIIYAPAIVLFLARKHLAEAVGGPEVRGGGGGGALSGTKRRGQPRRGEPRSSRQGAARQPGPTRTSRSPLQAPLRWGPFAAAVLRQGAAFGALSGGVFLALGAAFYRLYGDPFLQEAFLHHLTRKDPRHCFSVHWYSVYLDFMRPWPAATAAAAAEQGLAAPLPAAAAAAAGAGGGRAWDPAALAPLPQAAALLALAGALHEHLPFCWLLQTIAFVAFNKVSTAQYFVWWFALLPAALPGLPWPPRGALAAALAAWAAAQLHWLAWGYLLEFEGAPAHLGLWAASLVFLIANAALIVALLRAWDPPVSFLQLAVEGGGGAGGGGEGGSSGSSSGGGGRRQARAAGGSGGAKSR